MDKDIRAVMAAQIDPVQVVGQFDRCAPLHFAQNASRRQNSFAIFYLNTVETTKALLLRKTKLTDTSLIVTWFTEAHGKIQTVAKGARQPKSRFAGVLDLFYECEIQFARSRRSELHILREAVLLNPHAGLRQDYSSVALASYCVELIELVTESDHAAPELHDLLLRALGHLNEKPPSRRALMHFEAELVRLLGIQGQQNVTPAVAIGRVYYRLPKSRPELVKRLE